MPRNNDPNAALIGLLSGLTSGYAGARGHAIEERKTQDDRFIKQADQRTAENSRRQMMHDQFNIERLGRVQAESARLKEKATDYGKSRTQPPPAYPNELIGKDGLADRKEVFDWIQKGRELDTKKETKATTDEAKQTKLVNHFNALVHNVSVTNPVQADKDAEKAHMFAEANGLLEIPAVMDTLEALAHRIQARHVAQRPKETPAVGGGFHIGGWYPGGKPTPNPLTLPPGQ
jgi:hypothetical protein